MNYRKRYSRRKTIEESLFEDKSSVQRLKLSRVLRQDLLRFPAPGAASEDTDQNLQLLDSIIEDVTSESGIQ